MLLKKFNQNAILHSLDSTNIVQSVDLNKIFKYM